MPPAERAVGSCHRSDANSQRKKTRRRYFSGQSQQQGTSRYCSVTEWPKRFRALGINFNERTTFLHIHFVDLRRRPVEVKLGFKNNRIAFTGGGRRTNLEPARNQYRFRRAISNGELEQRFGWRGSEIFGARNVQKLDQ